MSVKEPSDERNSMFLRLLTRFMTHFRSLNLCRRPYQKVKFILDKITLNLIQYMHENQRQQHLFMG